MNPFEIFDVFGGGLNGIVSDLRTVMLWGAGIMLTMLGMSIVIGIMNRGPGSKEGVQSPGISLDDYRTYAAKRYKKELYNRRYKNSHFGEASDLKADVRSKGEDYIT